MQSGSVQVQYFGNMAYLWSIENFRILKGKFSPLCPNILPSHHPHYIISILLFSIFLFPCIDIVCRRTQQCIIPAITAAWKKCVGMMVLCSGSCPLPCLYYWLCWNAAGELGIRHVSNVWQLQQVVSKFGCIILLRQCRYQLEITCLNTCLGKIKQSFQQIEGP